MARDGFGNASHQESLDTIPSMRSHYDYIGIPLLEYATGAENTSFGSLSSNSEGSSDLCRASPTVLVGVQFGGCSDDFALSTAAP
jgi:hypothetical protein